MVQYQYADDIDIIKQINDAGYIVRHDRIKSTVSFYKHGSSDSFLTKKLGYFGFREVLEWFHSLYCEN